MKFNSLQFCGHTYVKKNWQQHRNDLLMFSSDMTFQLSNITALAGVSHPSINQAWPCLASGSRED